jgi:hypothetical protein
MDAALPDELGGGWNGLRQAAHPIVSVSPKLNWDDWKLDLQRIKRSYPDPSNLKIFPAALSANKS